MKKIALVVSIVMITALAACSASITVTSDWDPAFDFSQSQTFVLLENDIPAINRFIEQRVTAAIAADLSSKGLRQVNNVGDADLVFGFDIATENRTSYRTTHSGFSNNGWHSNSARWGMTTGTSRTTQRNYTVGTLIISAFDSVSKELVWETAGAGTIDPAGNPNESQESIDNKVERILRDFPPKA